MRKSTLQYFKSRTGEWHWRFKSSNGNILAISGEGYTRRRSAIKNWNSLFSAIAKHTYKTVGDE